MRYSLFGFVLFFIIIFYQLQNVLLLLRTSHGATHCKKGGEKKRRINMWHRIQYKCYEIATFFHTYFKKSLSRKLDPPATLLGLRPWCFTNWKIKINKRKWNDSNMIIRNSFFLLTCIVCTQRPFLFLSLTPHLCEACDRNLVLKKTCHRYSLL